MARHKFVYYTGGFSLLFALILPPLPVFASRTQPSDVSAYQDTMRDFNRGAVNDGLGTLQQVRSPLLRKVALGALLAQPDTPYDFAQISSFIAANPSWPDSEAMRERAEEKLPPNYSATQIINWLTTYPPLTLRGFDRLIVALRETGQEHKIAALIQDRWVKGSFGSTEQLDFLARYQNYLRPSDHWARLDRLLWDKTTDAAERMLPLVEASQATVARARLNPSRSTLAAVPEELQNDAGFIYSQLKQARQQNDDGRAVELLVLQPQDPPEDELWWNERQIIARRYLGRKDYNRAYQLAAYHRFTRGMAYHQAEFLAGWIALRFLDNPEQASEHFTRLYTESSLPITKARGAYWLGRCYQAQDDNSQAAKWYQKAALFPTSFYGQLAQAMLAADSGLTVLTAAISHEERTAFTARDTVQIAALLHEIGERKRAETFIMAMANTAKTSTEFTLLAQMASRLERYDLTVRISKLATKNGHLLEAEAYPIPAYSYSSEPEKALVLGLIRQESMFNPTIASSAQAVGLMQLLPSTAQDEARKLDIAFSSGRLVEPNYNIRLGSHFLADRIEQFDGSWIMAIASYNAGPARVKQWVQQIGDPRNGVDPIDWIELIPIYETRNYVHRVLEATQIYRARLNNGLAPLKLKQDLGMP